jgi:hypothetical protein
VYRKGGYGEPVRIKQEVSFSGKTRFNVRSLAISGGVNERRYLWMFFFRSITQAEF